MEITYFRWNNWNIEHIDKHHITPEEIENAMRQIAQYALSISVESLIAETARVFGFTHAGEKTKARMRGVYEKMVRERKLISNNGVVSVP